MISECTSMSGSCSQSNLFLYQHTSAFQCLKHGSLYTNNSQHVRNSVPVKVETVAISMYPWHKPSPQGTTELPGPFPIVNLEDFERFENYSYWRHCIKRLNFFIKHCTFYLGLTCPHVNEVWSLQNTSDDLFYIH